MATTKLKPREILQKMADEYKAEVQKLQTKYKIRHYRNSCGMVGVFSGMSGISTSEFLVGDASKVNCPWCKPLPKKKSKKK